MEIDEPIDLTNASNGVNGHSFTVHDVEPGSPDMPRISMNESLRTCLTSGENFAPEVLAVSDPAGAYLQLPSRNGFLAAVHLAFSHHLPLTLTPDIIWLAILQGFGRHIHAHARELEGRLMIEPGKHVIQIDLTTSDWEWPEVFEQFAAALEGHAGPWIRNLQADFTTTGKIERTASHVALMDLFSPYVQFIAACLCGIPSISLKGHASDWVSLREKLGLLRGYDIDDWIDELDEILARFVDAACGKVDRAWWQQIYKLKARYAGEDIEGWLGAFFPYLKDKTGTYTRRREKGESMSTEIVPPGLSDVAVKLVERNVGSHSLRAISGFLGVEDLGSEGVMPRIGWAVVRNHFMESFVESLDEYPGIQTRPPVSPCTRPRDQDRFLTTTLESLPVDIQLFYNATDGADVFGQGMIHPLATLLNSKCVNFSWYHLGIWCDGSLLLLNDAVVRLRWTGDTWEWQTLALTFSEFLQRLTAANGDAYWQQEDFIEPELTPHWKAFSPRLPDETNPARNLELLLLANRRLWWKKLARHDAFLVRPPSGKHFSRVPAALHSLYQICDGVVQGDGFEIWPNTQVKVLPGGQSRWFEVGAAPGYRIIFDAAADRGVAVIAINEQRIFQIAKSFAEFFAQVEKAPQTLYWAGKATAGKPGPSDFGILWPDEKVGVYSGIFTNTTQRETPSRHSRHL